MLYSRRNDFSLVVFFFRNFRAIFVPFEAKWKKNKLRDFGVTVDLFRAAGYCCLYVYACPLTSDLVDDQVHFAVGALAQLPDHLVVLVDLQPLQVLGCDQLQLVQDVHVGSRHQRRGTHSGERFSGQTGVKKLRNRRSGRTRAAAAANTWCHCTETREDTHFKMSESL